MDDIYYTISRPARAEIKVKGSRFIAETHLVTTIDEAGTRLAAIRKREHAATHHCYAWRMGLYDETEFRYSDDGEPSGTAGRPIYDALEGRSLTNILLVVTRYFGGTKLGTGGLVRAYSEAAGLVLEQSGVKENHVTERILVDIDFAHYDLLVKAMHHFSARQIQADFSDRVAVELEIRKSRADQLIDEIAELSSGRAEIRRYA
ncbi:MAG: IMPACT family protein [candidate division Zixibacteria bacterium]|nr:IMPACT family protein [candidate division Zixibacteria bacterium]